MLSITFTFFISVTENTALLVIVAKENHIHFLLYSTFKLKGRASLEFLCLHSMQPYISFSPEGGLSVEEMKTEAQ